MAAGTLKGIRFLDQGEERVLVSAGRANKTFLLGKSGGPRGAAGKSAYQLAVDEGFTGSLQDWLDLQRGFVVLDGPEVPTPDDLLDHTFVWERV